MKNIARFITSIFAASVILSCSTEEDSFLRLDFEAVLADVQAGAQVLDVTAVERDGVTVGYMIAFADGRCTTLLDVVQGSVVNSLSEDSSGFCFDLEGGEKITLPKTQIQEPFSVMITGDDVEISDGGTVTADYKVSGVEDGFEISALVGEGWSADITESSDSEGTITVCAPDPITTDKVLVSVTDGSGRQVVKALRLTTKSSVKRGNIETYAFCGVGYRLTDPAVSTYEKALERYKAVNEGGVQIMTTAIFDGWGFDEVVYQLDLAAAAGIKLAVYIEHYGGSQLREFINLIKDHPGLWGYQQFDEPNADEFERMYNAKCLVREIDTNPEHLFMLNVGGDGGTFGPYGSYHADNYAHYMDRLVNEAHVDMISFDYYPCIEDYVDEDDWFASLQTVSDKALQYDLPFWAYCCTCRFRDSAGMRCKPSMASIRLQDYTNLAYGAQGLEYFTWDAAGDLDKGFCDWVLSIDGEINTTNPTFDYLKAVNEEVQNRAFVFDGCSLKWAALYKDAPEGIRMVDESQFPEEIAAVSSDRGLTMSLIENDGGKSEYFNIVSRTHLKSTTVHLRLRYPVQTVERDGSLTAVNPGDHEFTLEPGDILILKTK